MAKFKIGDKVKIIQRKKNNTSGTEKGWNEPNGNVGEIGYVKDITSNSYNICRTKDEKGYFGWFDEDDLELVSEEVSTTPYVKGKWYGCEHWVGEHNYVKLNYVSNEQVYFTECINNKEYQVKRYWWSIVRSELFEADMSIVSQFLPEGHPDKIGSKEIDMQAIQEEAKRRFPIGCKFIPADSDKTHTLIEDECTYEIHGKYIWAHNGYRHLYENGKWATLVSLPEIQKEESIPEYVECVSPLLNATVGKIYKVINHNVCESDSKEDYYHWKTSQFKPSTKEAYEAQNAISAEYIPQVGDYVVMEKAGGWGYSPHNNGCIAIVEKVSTREAGYSSELKTVFSIGGQVINPKKLDDIVFTNVPIMGLNKERIFRKALPHEIPNDLPKKTVIEEWEPGTYAVGVKGNFGAFTERRQLIPIGHIYTIKENRTDQLVVEGKEFWVYKNNLKWFATREEAETFSKGLITGHITIDSSEKVKPISQLWMGDPIVEERINTPSIKKETFIEDVQSVNVMLRTKKKSIKF